MRLTDDTIDATPADRELSGLVVLLVEGDPGAALFALALEQRGARVVTAGSVRKAREVVERVAPNVLATGVPLPEADAFCLVRRIGGGRPRARTERPGDRPGRAGSGRDEGAALRRGVSSVRSETARCRAPRRGDRRSQ